MKKFENKVVLITGGSGGIGATAVKMFVNEGAKLMLFLAGDDSEFITGTVNPIDGGMTV